MAKTTVLVIVERPTSSPAPVLGDKLESCRLGGALSWAGSMRQHRQVSKRPPENGVWPPRRLGLSLPTNGIIMVFSRTTITTITTMQYYVAE